jgi:uncharacterized protein YkwD
MQLVKTLSVLALTAGAVVAMPAHAKRQWRGGQGSNRWWDRPSPDAEVTVTGYTPQPTDWNAEPDASSPTAPAVPTTTEVVVEATPTPAGNWGGNGGNWGQPAPAETPAPTTDSWSAPAPSSAPAPATGGSGGQDDYMSVVSKWRAAGGLKPLTQDSQLEANALKTANDSGGQLKHELNPGSMAQVLAPGDSSDFESVYVGGWLCEIPSLPGLDGICSSMAQGWDHSNGETGHADILTSGSYSNIGCALAEGIWACDL